MGKRSAGLGALLFLYLAPLFLPPYLVQITSEVALFAVFAMSLDLLLGYTGLASLGHGAFFGLGAYGVAIMTVRWGLGWAPALALSLLLVFLAALVIGFFCLKATGTAFLMLTLAFSQMVYAVAHKWTSITGGSDGLAGVARPLVTVAGLTLDFSSPILFGYLSFLVASGTYLLLRQVTRSPFGTVLVGIRENPLRMSALGFPVRRIQLFAFVLAALLAGTAGFFYALFNGFVSPEELYWPTSAMVLVMVILGGTGTLIGPMLGAAFVIWAEDLLSSATERWPMVVGGVFVLFVCAARGGFVGLWRRMRGGQGEPAAG